MVVKDIMTANPATVTTSDPIGVVLQTLDELDVRHVPVVDNSILMGLISDRDVRSFNLPSRVQEMNPGKAAKRLEAPVGSIMDSNVFSVELETEVAEVIRLMIDQKFGAIPVVDIDGKLAGIVSYIDILRAAEELF